MKTHLLIILFLLFSSTYLLSQQSSTISSKKILEERGEVYFKFNADINELPSLSKMLSIDSYRDNIVYAYANKKEFQQFLSLNKEYSLVDSYYKNTKALTMATSVAGMQNWNRYPTYNVYVQMMQKFANDYPQICKLDTIGMSYNNRLILAVKISDNVHTEECEPEFFYTAQMHGDELIGQIVLLRLIDYLLSKYNSDLTVKNLVDNLQIYINPLANPDGTYAGGNNSVSNSIRNNGEGIDINRNFPDALSGEHPDGNQSAHETLLFMQYAQNRKFVIGANLHSGAELVNYPFDTYATLPADNDWWNMVSREYANKVQEVAPTNYFKDQDNGITHGYAWYSVDGSRQDYMNYFRACREFTLELSTTKKLDVNELPNHWNYNKPALLQYLQQATYGLRGIITDSVTLEPLKANVFIENHDSFNSDVYSFLNFGNYYRYLYQGNYNVTFSAEGYRSKTINVNIENYQQTILNVQLVKLTDTPPIANFTSNHNEIQCNPYIQFTNQSQANNSTNYIWYFGDDAISNETNPLHYYSQSGSYNVKLVAYNQFGRDSIIKNNYITINIEDIQNLNNYTFCGTNQTITINPNLTTGIINWYDNITDTFPKFTGIEYEINNLNESRQVFVEQQIIGNTYNVGELDNSGGGSYISNSSSNYLIFDCFQRCILQKLTIYSQTSETRTIFIRTENDETIYNADIYVPEGTSEIELNILLPIANNLKIGCTNPNGLYRGYKGITNRFDYPYTIENMLSIKTNNDVYWNDGNKYYSYFYNWVVKSPDCYTKRSPINIIAQTNPIADFTYTKNENTFIFTNNSTNADSYIWDFGDNTNTTEINPQHTYNQSGQYSVVLTAINYCDSVQFTQIIDFETNKPILKEDSFSIFPNPTTDKLIIESKTHIQSVKVVNTQGVVIIKTTNNIIDMSNLENGLYFIEIENNNQKSIYKIAKINER